MNNNLDGCVFYKFDTCYFYPANWILNHKILVKELFKDFADESVVAEQEDPGLIPALSNCCSLISGKVAEKNLEVPI